MPTRDKKGRSPLERLRRRYENSDTKCPECGYVDDDSENWRSHMNGKQVVYHHTCPSCNAAREYTFHLNR